MSYQWAFEDVNGSSTHQYLPVRNGVTTTLGTITTCGGGAVNCRVRQEDTGRTGKGLRFDPTADSSFAWIAGGGTTSSVGALCTSNVIEFGDRYGDLDQPIQMTVAMWINPDRIEAGQTYHLFGTGNPVETPSGIITATFHVRIVDGKVQLSLYPSSNSLSPDMTLDSATTLAVSAPGSNWHHVAVTYNNFAVAMYIDGRLDAVGTRDADHRALCAARRPYYLGGLSSLVKIDGGPIEKASYIFPGVIDQLVFSNRAYSPSEIGQLATQAP
ncbi:MAG: LamG domain-containing protein [Acidobacteriota bacterium]